MKNIFIISLLVLTCGLVKAQSNREDIEIRWPKAEAWKPDEKLSVQTDFSRRRQKWDLKHNSKESWQKMVMILNDDLTKNTRSLDSIDIFPDLSNDKSSIFKLLKEKKTGLFPYKLISLENPPISTLTYLIDGKTCRHIVLISVKTSKFSADFLKQWTEILLNSRIVPSKAGNYEYTDDAYLDINGVDQFHITARFKSDQVQHLLKGQTATIIVDDLPEFNLSGTVSEISHQKNANDFPLTAPNNQSGNYLKMMERFPVTIKLEIPAAAKDKFKSKMSCSVKIATAP
ncbi:hypothetical protein SAMN05421820_1062 [Pedobacter steynii]|uniref:HlyD family secretion protein n=1 Tax=Pedobacter steynii TaxID=430522 RepID=A0A1G9Y6B9_9SPHI|nr:HlyD family efflux transporter periplasmic adaptor subunit [Pedobacter steynii]NQX39608.1 hypothetical protein [Pedobacter steynii]SDN04025.1 hypothetical protein SAMN05421820_1062 [Pedobacter steynii]